MSELIFKNPLWIKKSQAKFDNGRGFLLLIDHTALPQSLLSDICFQLASYFNKYVCKRSWFIYLKAFWDGPGKGVEMQEWFTHHIQHYMELVD